MSNIVLKLVGCERYNFRGELYLSGKVYRVGDIKGAKMLRSQDEYGRPYFVEFNAAPKKVDVVAQAAAAAAAKAALALAEEEDEVVDRPDGSEPIEPAQIAADERDDTPEEVDTDEEDLDLDADDEDNSEEVSDDRDDGSAVNV